MTDHSRLIEHAFPLKQASIDSVHEKSVRHGHISTLHIWPARRPLAACRAALVATLLPDPGDPALRKELCEMIGGKITRRLEKKKMPNGQTVERIKEETNGGILHWGRESEDAETLEWFRKEIRKAYGGRAPRVLDPFAGGGAIPLEAMRLGCEATAVDINPVAWFILKCTLEYPQRLAGQRIPLPGFALEDESFMREYFTKGLGYGGAQATAALDRIRRSGMASTRKAKEGNQRLLAFESSGTDEELNADLAWQVRAWGRWVLAQARRELAKYYPVYADFQPLRPEGLAYERQTMQQVPLREDGIPDLDALNADFTQDYLENPRNPRWVAKPTVAYLWARTVRCKNCRAEVPLLKTRWLCRKAGKRVLLTMTPRGDRSSVVFGIEADVPVRGGNAAQRREHDKLVGSGTMSRSGARCPCCKSIMTMQDMRVEGQAGRMGSVMTAVITDYPGSKEYRLPTDLELSVANPGEDSVNETYGNIPFGPPDEATPAGGGSGAGRAFGLHGYGLTKWRDLFTQRQLLTVGTLTGSTRAAWQSLLDANYSLQWAEAIYAGLAVGVDRIADRQSNICRWDMGRTNLQGTFTRFALSITWDFCEGNPLSDTTGNYLANLEWVAGYFEHALAMLEGVPTPSIHNRSAIRSGGNSYDIIVTDPPYYDAIPYSDLMDFFYVWLRRSTFGQLESVKDGFTKPLSPKWDSSSGDGELIDDSSRHSGDAAKSKRAYEQGMAMAFTACAESLTQDGRMVVVFANKQPDAWETLVTAVIQAGFTVTGSWPIQTEMANRTRALSSAALASSVWLVCRKREANARPGWDNRVLEEMREKIGVRLREFWDAGIRGPDFVWAATGPALEAYSRYPVVRKADEPNSTMGVNEFLTHVRRLVVDYVVGQVLSRDDGSGMASPERLDEVTAYYLLHRNDFGMGDAPIGACILYATACGLSDSELERTWDVFSHAGSGSNPDDEGDGGEDDESSEESVGSGSAVRLRAWHQRRGKAMGFEAPNGREVPMLDRIHRLMHMWRGGDVQLVDEYIDQHALRRNDLFRRVVQAMIELSEAQERPILESISNHIGARGAAKPGADMFKNGTRADLE